MSSNRRILESMLTSENNATRNNPHHNGSNVVRARLARLIESRNAQQNDTLPFSITVASSDGSIDEFASDAGENLDMLKERGLLTDLGMQQIGANQCKELGDELYYNPECYPYFKSIWRTDNDDAKQHFTTLLAMYACSPNTTSLSDAQRAAIDDYCKYNDDKLSFKDIRVIIPVTSLLTVFIFIALAAVFIHRRRLDRAAQANSAAVASALSLDPLSQPLLDSNHSDAAVDSRSQEEEQRRGRTTLSS